MEMPVSGSDVTKTAVQEFPMFVHSKLLGWKLLTINICIICSFGWSIWKYIIDIIDQIILRCISKINGIFLYTIITPNKINGDSLIAYIQ